MRVTHLAPAAAQAVGVDLRIGALDGGAVERCGGERRLPAVGEALDESNEGGAVGVVDGEDLVHGGAGGVVELEARAQPGFAVVGDGEADVPAVEEEPQIDGAAENETGVPLDVDLLERPLLLDHGVLVAGEGHHPAERRQRFEDRLPLRPQARGRAAAKARDHLALARAQMTGGVAQAEMAVLGAQGDEARAQVSWVDGRLHGSTPRLGWLADGARAAVAASAGRRRRSARVARDEAGPGWAVRRRRSASRL